MINVLKLQWRTEKKKDIFNIFRDDRIAAGTDQYEITAFQNIP